MPGISGDVAHYSSCTFGNPASMRLGAVPRNTPIFFPRKSSMVCSGEEPRTIILSRELESFMRLCEKMRTRPGAPDFQMNDGYEWHRRQNIGLPSDHGVHQIVTAAEHDNLQSQVFSVKESLFLCDEHPQAGDDLQVSDAHLASIFMGGFAGPHERREENNRGTDRQ